MADLIKKTDNLNQGREKLNAAITDAEQAKVVLGQADDKATEALAQSESTQTQLDTIVIEGDSSVEAAQARVSLEGTAYSTLKQRLDAEYSEVTTQLAQTPQFANVMAFGADPSGVEDSTNAIRSALLTLNKGVLYFPKGKYKITDSIVLKSNIKVQGESQFSSLIYPDCDVMNEGLSVPKPCFRLAFESGTDENISINNIGIDSSNASPTIMASQLFSNSSGKGLKNFHVDSVYGINQYQLIKLQGGSNLHFNNILLDKPTITSPLPPENALSFAKCDTINISNIITHDTIEIIDMSQCADVNIINVIGSTTIEGNNEAIDVGGCRNVSMTNVKTNGFGKGVKLKQEGSLPEYLITQDITIQNCQFKNFTAYGIEFLTNTDLQDYVIKNVKIENCVIESNLINTRGVHQQRYKLNYGVDELKITNCSIKSDNNTISLNAINNLLLSDNDIKSNTKYDGVAILGDEYQTDKRKNYVIKNNTIRMLNSSGTALNLSGVDKLSVEQNKIMLNAGAGINTLNIKNLSLKDNEIYGGDNGCLVYWNNETFLDSVLKTIGAIITGNRIENFKTYGIRFNLDMHSSAGVTGPYKKAIISGNEISLDNSVLKSGQIGVQFRTRYVSNHLDYIKCDNNLVYNVPTPIAYDQATFGVNSTNENNTLLS